MNYKNIIVVAVLTVLTVWPSVTTGRNRIYNDNVKTLQAVVNGQWQKPAVMRLGSGDELEVSFDELSHNYHRYVCHIERCEADWSASEGLFESDWLEGFNDLPIEDYENSLNTTVLYTHYRMALPNDRCRLKMSGNYRLHIIDEEADDEVACVEIRVAESEAAVGLSMTTNTDIDFNQSHQQLQMTVRLGSLRVTDVEGQLWTVVTQNGREDTQRINMTPTAIQQDRLQWEHCRDLIFEAGNVYHKYEVLDVSHPTMGIDRIRWDGTYYQVFPFANGPRRSYTYDESANGGFLIRNSENTEVERTCDYVFVNFKMMCPEPYGNADIVVDGAWATEEPERYVMWYDESDGSYNARILQKQGYYSYQYVVREADGTTRLMPEEGSFFETQNRYQAYVYYKGVSDRSWRLVGFHEIGK